MSLATSRIAQDANATTADGASPLGQIPPELLTRRFDERARTGLLIACAIVLPSLAARAVVVLREPTDQNWRLSITVLLSEILATVIVAAGYYFRRLPLAAVQPATAFLSLYMMFGACLVVVLAQVHWPSVAVVIVLVGAGNVLLSWRWLLVVATGGTVGLLCSLASIEALTASQWVEVFFWIAIFFGIALAAHTGRVTVYRRIETLRWRDDRSRKELTDLVARLRHEVDERRAAEAKLRQKESELRGLTHRLLTLQETERGRISRELHDELGQILSAINMQLLAARRMAASEALIDRLDECGEMVREGIDQVRQLSTELRPSVLDDFGLETALRWIVERQADRAELPISYETQNSQPRFPLEVEAACFRIAQEAITNALRHAGASRIRVSHVNAPDRLVVRVEDDGVGFEPESIEHRPIQKLSLGLLGMRERAESLGGRIVIRSSKGQGATVEVQFRRDGLPHSDGEPMP